MTTISSRFRACWLATSHSWFLSKVGFYFQFNDSAMVASASWSWLTKAAKLEAAFQNGHR